MTRALAAVVFCTILLTPLVFLPVGVQPPMSEIATNLHGAARAVNIHDRTTLPQVMVGNLGSALALALLVLWAWRIRSLKPLARWGGVTLLAIGGGLVLATVALHPLHDAVVALRPYLPYLAAAGVFWSTMLCPEVRRPAVIACVLVAAVLAGLVLAEEWGLPMPASGEPYIDPPTATLVQRNLAALIILPAVPLALAVAAMADGRLALLAGVAAGITTAGLFATRSRTCLLAAAAGIVVVMMGGRWRRMSRATAAALGASAVLGLSIHHLSPMASSHVSLSQKLRGSLALLAKERGVRMADGAWGVAAHVTAPSSTLDTPPAPPPRDDGVTERIYQWTFALKHIRQQPWTGFGLGNYRMMSQRASATRWQPHAHNVWLHIAVELGLPALLLALIATGLVAAGGWRLLRRNSMLGVAGAAGLAALAVASLFEAYLGAVGPNLLFAALTGCVVGWSSAPREAAA